jgi:hypothetical protein
MYFIKTIFKQLLIRHSIFALCIICPVINYAQSTIKGKVTDTKGVAVPFASVFIKNTISGTTTDADGNYLLKTNENGNLTLVTISIGYDSSFAILNIESGKEYTSNFKLKENSAALDEVVVSAGAFDASNDRKIAVLRPMDIYTTAGGAGDIVGAIQTLPGAQKVSDQTGLFVRGGDATESATIVDGMVMQNAFMSGVPGVAQRSRFTPNQFKGVSFSSGGYSARYGEALSGVLELNTNDLAEKTTISTNINQAGISASGAKLFKNQSLEGTFSYTNLQPFYSIAKTNFNFYQPPVGFGGSARWVWTNDKNDILKLFVNVSEYQSGTDVINPVQPDTTLRFNLKNTYGIGNLYYKHFINEKTYTTFASSYSNNYDNVNWGNEPYDKKDWRIQGRGELVSEVSKNIFGFIGTEVQNYSIHQTYDTLKYNYTETQIAAYSEAEWKPKKWFGLKVGGRYEYSKLLNKSNVAPRYSAAFRLNKYGQIAFAGGIFYQNAADKYLLVGDRPNFQQAIHSIINYQYTNEERTFRVEGYYKSYNQLIKELQGPYNPNPYRLITSPVDNSGYGYAKGIDFFWRDKTSVKNLDYWISYSYIDTKRLYENYPVSATPIFISNNNLNVVTKYTIGKTGFNISATYSYASGRPYYDPTSSTFLGGRAPDYQNLAVQLNYIFTVKKLFGVIYISGDNVTNHKNVLGYRYTYPALEKYPILPAMYRSVFVGVLLSITPFKKEDL